MNKLQKILLSIILIYEPLAYILFINNDNCQKFFTWNFCNYNSLETRIVLCMVFPFILALLCSIWFSTPSKNNKYEEKDNKQKPQQTTKKTELTKKQIVICNLVGFEFLHFILEVIATTPNNSSNHIGAAVVINYLISYWVIKPQIDKKSKKELIGYTWLIALFVLGTRALLGVMFVELMG